MGGLLLSFAWLLGGGCGASSKPSKGGPSNGDGGSSVGGTQGKPNVIDVDGGDADAGTTIIVNTLCGNGTMAGSCVPDDPRACSTFEPPAETPSGASGAGGDNSTSGTGGGVTTSGGDAGTSGGGGTSGASGQGEPPSDGGAAGYVGAAGERGSGESDAGGTGAGGAPESSGGQGGDGSANPPGLPLYGCQVTRLNNERVRQCTAAGRGAANAPCFSAADCSPGLACVSDGDAGRCRPYCCDADTDCDKGAYCAERPLRKLPSDTSNTEAPRVPVCVPADNCSLEERFPCPTGNDCRCKADTACMLVRDDGATACLKPGSGVQGDACPCAWNHVCSSATHECVKLCRTDAPQNDCGAQKCQASSELPKNFGVCVGPR